VFRTEPIALRGLPALLLALFGGLGSYTRGLGLGFPLGRVTLRVGLVLLGLALADKVIVAGQSSANLFRLALDTFDDPPNRLFRSALLIPHGTILPHDVVGRALGECAQWLRIQADQLAL
jgi:hypothetical protein